MAKYLFLLGMYYPRSSANGVCCKNIVDELIAQGYDVTCIVNSDLTRPEYEIIDGAKIFRIKPRLYYRMQEWCYYHPKSKYNNIIKALSIIINKATLFIMSSIWPIVSPGYTFRFYNKAKQLHKSEKFDAVIAVYTPIDTLYAGYLLKKTFNNIKFIPYYLDALAGGWGPTRWSKEKIDRRTRKLEMKIDRIADILISMKSSEKYHTENPLNKQDSTKRVYLDVPTFAYNKENTENCEAGKNNNIIVLYSGSIHFPDRDPRPLLKHFVSICKECDVELWFMGNNNCQSLFDEYKKISGGRIKTIGQFSHKEAIAIMSKVDAFVNIGNTNPNTVTSKIFEYIQFRKPIISTYSIVDEPAIPYLKKYENHFFLDERKEADFEKVNTSLKRFLLQDHYDSKIDYSKVYYLNTPQAFIDTITAIN